MPFVPAPSSLINLQDGKKLSILILMEDVSCWGKLGGANVEKFDLATNLKCLSPAEMHVHIFSQTLVWQRP